MVDPDGGVDQNALVALSDGTGYQSSRSDFRYASAPCHTSRCKPRVRFANFLGFGMITTRSDLHSTRSSSPADKESASRAACGMTIWYLLLKVTVVLTKASLISKAILSYHFTLLRSTIVHVT